MESKQCGQECEVYSRSCGYYRPVAQWNRGKKEEFKDRKTFKIKDKDKTPGKTVGKALTAPLLATCLVLLASCAALKTKAVGIASEVDAVKLETVGGVASGTFLPNLIIGGALSAVAAAPVVKQGSTSQVVFIRQVRRSLFGELFGLDIGNEAVIYLGVPGETAAETAQRLAAFAQLNTAVRSAFAAPVIEPPPPQNKSTKKKEVKVNLSEKTKERLLRVG